MSETAEMVTVDRVAGLPAPELAERFGTPLYVYDLDGLTDRVERLRAALPAGCDLAFAVKANPALGVLRHLAGLGLGADVASGGELEAALLAGFPPERIVFTGPGKRDDEIAAAVQCGVRAITVESPGELARVRAAAGDGARDGVVPILLRLDLAGTATDRPLIAGSGPSKFGMSLDVLRGAIRTAVAAPEVRLLGIHAFGASNVRDADAWATRAASLVELAAELLAEHGAPPSLVDVGGGLGIPYADREAPLDLDRLGALLGASADRWRPTLHPDARVIVEPGRYLVGPVGAYLTRVLDVKPVGGAPAAIVDGGIHHLLRPALVGQEQRVRLLTPDASRSTADVLVAGPLCTGLDRFAASARLPEPRTGDLLAILDAGAYGFTESMPLFLSHPTPAEVAVEGGRARLIRERIRPSELLARQVATLDAERLAVAGR